jgi:hypothetical protein
VSQGLFGQMRKISSTPRFDPWTLIQNFTNIRLVIVPQFRTDRRSDVCTDIKRVRVAFRKCFPNDPKNSAIVWIGFNFAKEGVTSALHKRQHKRRKVLDDSQ